MLKHKLLNKTHLSSQTDVGGR